ncbi:multiple epidermal growth factor-like domains protein 10 [Saccostrea cucullata]|uniref:multiple epidermal growth factor-like domains protein 10 n=1 Tax=Saccostrea cuccullata TaxID=36930 RepID=UPI002ED4BEFC
MLTIFNAIIVLVLCSVDVYTQRQCTGDRGIECCEGYMWNNNTGNCIKCQTGYLGKSCSFKCPYPSFGESCQGRCECKETSCDFAKGCSSDVYNEENIQIYISTNNKIALWKTVTFSSEINAVATDKGEKQKEESTKELLFILVCVNSVVVLAAVIYIFKFIVKRAQTTRDSHHVSKSFKDNGCVYETADDTERNVAYHVIPDQHYRTVTVNISSPDQVQGDQGSPDKRSFEENMSVLNSEDTGGYLIPSTISLA